MPSDWLSVPHHKQSRDGQCLPACARMVLAYLGQDLDEARLARLLRTRPFGTPFVNDPAFDDAPQVIPLEHFLLAWSEFDYEYAVIRRA